MTNEDYKVYCILGLGYTTWVITHSRAPAGEGKRSASVANGWWFRVISQLSFRTRAQ